MARRTAPPQRDVYTLEVTVGRRKGDGLPKGAQGADLLCYIAARDEAEAVREAVAVLKAAALAPLDVVSHGTEAERVARDMPPQPEEQDLIARARAEASLIVAEVTPQF